MRSVSNAGRIARALLPAAAGLGRSLGRVVRQLALEITGAFFALFAAIGFVSAWRAWHDGAPGWVGVVSAGFGGLMGYFAVTAFWKAYRTSGK